LNLYMPVRLADIKRADPIEMTPPGGGGDRVGTSPIGPMESTIDMDTGEEPSDVPLRDKAAGPGWRTDLTDNTCRYDTLQRAQHSGPEGDQQATTAGNAKLERTLKHWINDIHGRGGDAVSRRRLSDSPISHHNSWERVPTHPTWDTPSGVYDGGGTPEGTSDKRTSGDKCDTQAGVFDGGGDRVLEIPPKASDRLRKAYIIRVDKITHMNYGLRDTRDNLKLDLKLKEEKNKLKLCSAATQSDDSVATE